MGTKGIKGAIKELLEIIRELYKADICVVCLLIEDMDEDEKLGYFEERLRCINEKYKEKGKNLPPPLEKYMREYEKKGKEGLRQYLKEIEILKFCFEEVQNPEIKEKLWKYTYKKRPPKWVIFKEYKEKSKDKSIIFEGLTAYSIRTETEIFAESSRIINSYPCTTHLQTEKDISPACKMVVFLHLKDPAEPKKIIGLIKIENYEEREEDKRRFHPESEETKKAREFLYPLVRLIKKTREFFYKEYSYQELYGGITLLELLKSTKIEQKSLNREIYRLTRHLFFVLKRKEYIDHDEILERVTNYAEDLSSIFELRGKKSFKEVLEQYKQQEDLMLYKIKGYRDHFMHQFHVFVLGYIILNQIGLFQITNWINKYLQHLMKRLRFGGEFKFQECDLLRIWFLTAFYHDTGYIIERFEIGISQYLKDLLDQDIPIRLDGAPLLKKPTRYAQYLETLLKYFYCCHQTNQDLLPHYLDCIIRMNDHPIYSAFSLINNFTQEADNKRITECYIAALAISFHSNKIYKHLIENSRPGISFESFPFAFLLAFCDTAQIWGREREVKDQHGRWELMNIEFNRNNQVICCKLLFKTKDPGAYPTPQEIQEKIIQDKNSRFRSLQYRFSIEFYAGESSANCVKIISIPFSI